MRSFHEDGINALQGCGCKHKGFRIKSVGEVDLPDTKTRSVLCTDIVTCPQRQQFIFGENSGRNVLG